MQPVRALLPAEIQDEIVDHLSEEPLALMACALTCRQWARRARMHLFRTVSVRDRSSLAQFELLLEADPKIARFVRVLTLSKAACAKLLMNMDRVEELNIGKLNLYSNPGVRNGLRMDFSRLRILRFIGVYDLDCEDFLSLLAACPYLEELYVSDMYNVKPDLLGGFKDSGTQPATMPALRSLTIGAASSIGISCLLFYSKLQTSLRRLQLSYNSTLPPEGADLIHRAAPMLEELVLRLHQSLPLAHILQALSPFQHLRRLHLKHTGLENKSYDVPHPICIVNTLGDIPRWDRRLMLQEIVLSMPMPMKKRWSNDNPGRDSPGTGFPFPWVQLDMTMAKLAEENQTLIFILNICGPWNKTRQVSLTDTSFGQYRLRVSRTEGLRPQVLKVLVGPHWTAIGEFGGGLRDIHT